MANKTIKKEDCSHSGELKVESSDKTKCDVCEVTENLRLCTSCGDVFCCESHNAHNKEHFEKTSHPIIKPLPAGTDHDWTWCYKDEAYLQ